MANDDPTSRRMGFGYRASSSRGSPSRSGPGRGRLGAIVPAADRQTICDGARAEAPKVASRGETSRPSRNIQSVYCVFTNYRQRSRSSRGGTCGPTCSLRHRRSPWRSHYSLSSAQRRRNERPRASRRTRAPYARLGSPDCGSNAHAVAGCTKSPCVMRISMLPLMIVIDGPGPPNQKP